MPPKDDDLSKKLGINPLIQEENPGPLFRKPISTIVSDVKSKEELDFDLAREKITSVLDTGTEAIEQMLEIAKNTEHPRSYEVLANLLKTQAEVSLDLLRLTQAKIQIDNLKGISSQSNQTINNNLIVGSADTLLKLIKSAKASTSKIIDVDGD